MHNSRRQKSVSGYSRTESVPGLEFTCIRGPSILREVGALCRMFECSFCPDDQIRIDGANAGEVLDRDGH